MILDKIINQLLDTDIVEPRRISSEDSLIRLSQKRNDLIAFIKLVINESNVPNKRDYLLNAVLSAFRDRMLGEYVDNILK